MTQLDWGIIVIHLLAVVGLGVAAGFLHRRDETGGEGGDHFPAGNTLAWPVIGLAMFGANISTLAFVQPCRSGLQARPRFRQIRMGGGLDADSAVALHLDAASALESRDAAGFSGTPAQKRLLQRAFVGTAQREAAAHLLSY